MLGYIKKDIHNELTNLSKNDNKNGSQKFILRLNWNKAIILSPKVKYNSSCFVEIKFAIDGSQLPMQQIQLNFWHKF